MLPRGWKVSGTSRATQEDHDPGSGRGALKCIWQWTMEAYLTGIKHRREQPQHGQACEVSFFFAINKWSSQTKKLNMHQSGHPGTLRDTKGSGTLKWRHYHQTIHEVCPLPLRIYRQWPLNLLSFEPSCKPVTFSHWNGTKDTGKTVSALSTT